MYTWVLMSLNRQSPLIIQGLLFWSLIFSSEMWRHEHHLETRRDTPEHLVLDDKWMSLNKMFPFFEQQLHWSWETMYGISLGGRVNFARQFHFMDSLIHNDLKSKVKYLLGDEIPAYSMTLYSYDGTASNANLSIPQTLVL